MTTKSTHYLLLHFRCLLRGEGDVTTRQNVGVADAYGSVVGICWCEAKKERNLIIDPHQVSSVTG